eukprot:5675883-Amphidinium_carterae.1
MDGSESPERNTYLGQVKKYGGLLAYVPEQYKADREIVLAAVKTHGDALRFAAEKCKADREIVLAAVNQRIENGNALQYAARECKADSAIVLAAVQQNWRALEYAAEECKADSAIVLAAVQQNWQALEYAAEVRKADREIVWAAVQQEGLALQCAAEECLADRQIVMAAVHQTEHDGWSVLQHAADELLLDRSFAPETKRLCYILKVSLLSGRSTAVMSTGHDSAKDIVAYCCRRLEIQGGGTEALVNGTEVVPATSQVRSWPGLSPLGEVSEYQLVMGGQ